jgi:hypothetical protein
LGEKHTKKSTKKVQKSGKNHPLGGNNNKYNDKTPHIDRKKKKKTVATTPPSCLPYLFISSSIDLMMHGVQPL